MPQKIHVTNHTPFPKRVFFTPMLWWLQVVSRVITDILRVCSAFAALVSSSADNLVSVLGDPLRAIETVSNRVVWCN